jgi:DNA-binding response OmpR family regulator
MAVMKRTIDALVIEDEADIRDAVVGYLSQVGQAAAGVDSVEAAEQWLEQVDAAVLVLDLSLPGESGLDWLARRPDLREKGIIMVTAAGREAERIAGRNAGADDYFVKPVNLVELSVGVRNLRDRLPASDHWQLDSLHWLLHAPNGSSVKLTASELALLESLAERPGAVVERDLIIRRLGADPQTYDIRRMEVMLRRLRVKIADQLGVEAPIATVRAAGYAFTATLECTGAAAKE